MPYLNPRWREPGDPLYAGYDGEAFTQPMFTLRSDNEGGARAQWPEPRPHDALDERDDITGGST